MKHTLTLVTSLLLAPLVALHAEDAAKTAKPNVLFIISDDQGFGDFGFNGNALVKTPNLDLLAAESAVYKNFVVAPACSPSRAAFFTGRNHLITGVWGVPPRANLRPDETRIPAYFKASGYSTLHVGKLDCVKVGKANGDRFGWDEWLGGGGYEHQNPMIYSSNGNRRGQGWTADIWTDYTLDFMRQHRDEPWFATVAYIIPHLPWICAEKYSAPFLAQGCSPNLAACYGSIAQMDECIGRLLEGLKETGQDQRTIVVFISDNGPTSPEAKQDPGDGSVPGEDWAKRNVAKLRGHKALVWENGDRVPMLVRWPGHIVPGERKQFGSAEDVLPTLLDLSGIPATVVPHLPITGVSLCRSLNDAAAAVERPEVFRMAIAGPGSPRDGIADMHDRKYEDHHLTLCGPRFKYHALPGGKSALYDTEADPGETSDVQAKFPDIAARMAKECRERWQSILDSGRAFVPPPPLPQAADKPAKVKAADL